ncbi:MAG: hypothetical protein ACFB2W_02730 [Leptolyngbyaceae cyanobacterium]
MIISCSGLLGGSRVKLSIADSLEKTLSARVCLKTLLQMRSLYRPAMVETCRLLTRATEALVST